MDKKMKKLFGCPFYDVNMGSCCLGRKTASIAREEVSPIFRRKHFPYRLLKEKLKEALNQCNQIGLFLKGLGNKFSCKSCPNFFAIFGLLLKTTLFK